MPSATSKEGNPTTTNSNSWFMLLRNPFIFSLVVTVASFFVLSSPPPICQASAVLEAPLFGRVEGVQEIIGFLRDLKPYNAHTKIVLELLSSALTKINTLNDQLQGFIEEVHSDKTASENLSKYFQNRIGSVKDLQHRQKVSEFAINIAKESHKKIDFNRYDKLEAETQEHLLVLSHLETMVFNSQCSRMEVLKKYYPLHDTTEGYSVDIFLKLIRLINECKRFVKRMEADLQGLLLKVPTD